MYSLRSVILWKDFDKVKPEKNRATKLVMTHIGDIFVAYCGRPNSVSFFLDEPAGFGIDHEVAYWADWPDEKDLEEL